MIGNHSIYDVQGKDEVGEILARVDEGVRPILKKFNLDYSTTKESIAEHCLGFNRGRGRIIALNVRQKSDNMKFRKYSAIMRTMIHELTHIRHSDHRRPFRLFNAALITFAKEKGIYRPGLAESEMNTKPQNDMKIINRTQVKKMALEISRQERNSRFTRVSEDFLRRMESRLHIMIRDEVKQNPGSGKTLK